MTAEPPKIDNAPGLKWKARAKGQWEARWRPRRDLVSRGYRSARDVFRARRPPHRPLIENACSMPEDP